MSKAENSMAFFRLYPWYCNNNKDANLCKTSCFTCKTAIRGPLPLFTSLAFLRKTKKVSREPLVRFLHSHRSASLARSALTRSLTHLLLSSWVSGTFLSNFKNILNRWVLDVTPIHHDAVETHLPARSTQSPVSFVTSGTMPGLNFAGGNDVVETHTPLSWSTCV